MAELLADSLIFGFFNPYCSIFGKNGSMSAEHILFLDIETAPLVYRFEELSPRMQELFDAKTKFMQRDETSAADLYKKAGVYAEFGKVICISCGFLHTHQGETTLRVRSFFGDDEVEVLRTFAELLNQRFNREEHLLCAHNGKEFDFPFLCRRMTIHGIALPEILQLRNKKPWEVRHLDTMEMWKFGDHKHFTSLELLTELFGIPSPKDDIKGSEVGRVYWEEKDLDKIVRYCQKDVVALVQVYQRLCGLQVISHDSVKIVSAE